MQTWLNIIACCQTQHVHWSYALNAYVRIRSHTVLQVRLYRQSQCVKRTGESYGHARKPGAYPLTTCKPHHCLPTDSREKKAAIVLPGAFQHTCFTKTGPFLSARHLVTRDPGDQPVSEIPAPGLRAWKNGDVSGHNLQLSLQAKAVQAGPDWLCAGGSGVATFITIRHSPPLHNRFLYPVPMIHLEAPCPVEGSGGGLNTEVHPCWDASTVLINPIVTVAQAPGIKLFFDNQCDITKIDHQSTREAASESPANPT